MVVPRIRITLFSLIVRQIDLENSALQSPNFSSVRKLVDVLGGAVSTPTENLSTATVQAGLSGGNLRMVSSLNDPSLLNKNV